MQPKLSPRPIHVIAREIRNNWSRVHPAALFHLDNMRHLDKITDIAPGFTPAAAVKGFLSNSATWRGSKAREIKAELSKILDGAK